MTKEIPVTMYTPDQIEAMERENELEIEATLEWEATLDWEAEMQESTGKCVGFRGDDERDLDTEESP